MKLKEEKVKVEENLLEINAKHLEQDRQDFQKEHNMLASRDVDLSKRETNLKAAEKTQLVKDEHFKNQAKRLDEKEKELKVKEARIEVLRKELPKGAPGAGMEATILLPPKNNCLRNDLLKMKTLRE